MQQKILFFLFILGGLILKVKADTSEQQRFYPKIFEDRTQVLSVQELISKRYTTKFLHYSELKELRKDVDYWGKFELQNDSDFTKEYFLEFGDNARISCYIFVENEFIQIYQVGTSTPYLQEQKSATTIPLKLAPKSEQLILFRLRNPNHFPDFSLRLHNENADIIKYWETEIYLLIFIGFFGIILGVFKWINSYWVFQVSWLKMALITSAVLYFLMRISFVFGANENLYLLTAFWVYITFVLVDIFGKRSLEFSCLSWQVLREVFRALLPLFLAFLFNFLDYSILYFIDIMIGWEIVMSLGGLGMNYWQTHYTNKF